MISITRRMVRQVTSARIISQRQCSDFHQMTQQRSPHSFRNQKPVGQSTQVKNGHIN